MNGIQNSGKQASPFFSFLYKILPVCMLLLVSTNAFAAKSFTGLSVGPQTGSVTYGTAGSVTYDVIGTFAGSGNESCTPLSTSGLPAGVTDSFNPFDLKATGPATTATSILTLTIPVGTPAGSTSFTVSCTDGGGTGTTWNAIGTLTVDKANQATLTVTGPASLTYGSTGTLTSSGGSGTGAVSFSVGASTGCNITAGTTLNVSNASGTCTITATKAADTNYNATISAPFTVTLNKGNQTITFGVQAAQTYSSGGTFALSPLATASSGLAIAYTSTTTGVCTIAGTTVTIVTAGTCTIAANQAGNTNYNAAPQVTQNIAIGKANQTITFGAQAAQTYSSGGTFAISPLATASSGLAITYTSTTTGVCTIAGTTVTIVTVGTCTIAANQAGNTNYNAAPQVTQNIAINNPTPTTTSISPSSKIVGDTLFTMTVNGTNFVSTSVVNFNGSARTTTFVSATQLTATIPASDMTVAGTFNITVVNPAPGGGTSNAQVFTVVTPVIPVSSFNAFETTTVAGATTGVIQTKIAGSAFSLAVVAISGGAQSAGFTNAVKVELLGNTVTGIALDAQNCPTSSTLLQTVSPNPTISGGRSTVNFASVADAWKDVRVRISYPAAAPTVISCSTDNFAIRPNSLTVSVSDTDWQTAGTLRTLNNSGATGGSVHKAGQPLTIRVTAYDALGVKTSNYAGSPAAQPITCTLPTPPLCTNGTLAPGAWTAAGGTVTSTTATYSEAGSFNLTFQDTSFASVDSGDGTPADCTGYYVCSTAISVGRFVPDHFVLAASNVPQLKTFNNTACVIRSFTYIGQAFGYVTAPQVLVSAKNSANATTTNYTSNLWKLSTAGGAQDCTSNSDICTLSSGSVTQSYTYTTSTGALPNWDSAQVNLATPAIVAGTNGTGTVTSAGGDLLAFKRSITTPLSPFTASITLTESVNDANEAGNCGVANCNITTLTSATFNPIAFDSGNEFRYGRLKLSNADGSELLKLPIPIQTQYWNGTSFVTNTADNCTALSTNYIKLTAPPAGVSTTIDAFASGVGSLTLSPPTTAAYAAVNLCVDLGADPVGGTVCTATTSANLPYLQSLWAPGTSYNNDPGARATFGVYKGPSEFIYLRENY